MKFLKSTLLFLFLFMGTWFSTQAQDIHWSLYNMSPLTLNPALTGAYLGTARIGGIYRDQARSAIDNPYTTPSFYIDSPIIALGKKKKDWLGIGAVLYNDQAGSAGLSRTGAFGSVAYHKSLNKKGNTLLSIGLQGGVLQRGIDLMKLEFGDETQQRLTTGTAGTNSPSRMTLGDNSSGFDLNAGILLTSRLSKQTDLNIGLSFYHILTPTYSFENNASGSNKNLSMPLRIQFHGQLNFDMGPKWMLSPTFLYNKVGPASNIQVQGMLGYKLNEKDPMIIKLGPGYRLGDALEVLLNVDYKAFRFGAAYDFTLSDLSGVNNSQGGFEVALSYIIKIFKAPTVKPVIICPRF